MDPDPGSLKWTDFSDFGVIRYYRYTMDPGPDLRGEMGWMTG